MLPDEVPVLERRPVRLRPWRATDAGLVASVSSDPMIPLVTTVPAGGGAAEVEAYLARQHRRLAEGAGLSFAVADLATDDAVGSIGLWTRDLDAGRASTGYWIAAQHRGQGYAAAALRLLTSWALTLPEVERLELHVEPRNTASWATAEAAGYRREGLLRSWQRVGGVPRDMYVYSVLSDR